MKKDETNKIINCMIIIIILLVINSISLFVIISNTSKGNSETTKQDGEVDETYDISLFKEKTPSEVTKMIQNKENFVLFIGQKGCGYCEKMIPTLKSAQEKLKYTTVYLDIAKSDVTSNDYKTMAALLDVKITANGETKPFGEFTVTPMMAVITNGKMIDGMIGYDSYDNYVAFLKEAGIK